MTMLKLRKTGSLDKFYWVNSNNICYMRENIFSNKISVIIYFEVDIVQQNLTHLQEIHVFHTLEEIMSMVDKPALLQALIRE